jgi:hypothetical protein
MSGVDFDTIDNQKVVGIGDNLFEQGVIAMGAGATIAAGTVLKREGNKFAACNGADDEVPLAVVPFKLTNSGGAADIAFRALVSGKVRKELLTLNGAEISKAQADALRDYGIIAVSITDVSRVNP